MGLPNPLAPIGRMVGMNWPDLPILTGLLAGHEPLPEVPDRLLDLTRVRYNPGHLRGRYYVPADLPAGAPLVVVLHGCGQSAAVYDHGSGWSQLADRHGFALLFPEQRRANNPKLCFNWFSANHSQRGMGEPASIKSMIDAMLSRFQLDRRQVFVTGLSAGGAMAAVMLATYPERFAAGAVIAGVPYGCASGPGQAFDCMGGRGQADAAALAASVRRASPNKGPWPRLSVWHGSVDPTVLPSNSEAIVRQWAALHQVAESPARTDLVAGFPRHVWVDSDGREIIEHYEIIGMAHGTPLSGPGQGAGTPMDYMLDVGLSSTDRIADFFGLTGDNRRHGDRPRRRPAAWMGRLRRLRPRA